MYYNTTQLRSDDLKRRWSEAKRQEDLVFLIMQHREELTASELHQIYITARHKGESLANTPITSIRRAMNTLAGDGKIIKTMRKKPGPFGHPEHIYLIATKHKL